MLYKVKIDQSTRVYNDKKSLVLTSFNKKILIKLENTVSIYLKKKERILYIKFSRLPSLKIKENFFKKVLSIFTVRVKKAKETLSNLKKVPKNLVFLIGLGYRFELLKDTILLKLGYSHNILVPIPIEIQVFRPKENILVLRSISKEKLHIFMHVLQKYKKPDLYKNKGIRLNWCRITSKKIMKRS